MTSCNLCHYDYNGPDYSHEKCREEYRYRKDHNECVKCKRATNDSIYCDNCTSVSDYRGYSGGWT